MPVKKNYSDRLLEKDKTRRYSSAAGLAADIRRYLANLPFIARPASSMYLLRKFARRNRVLVAAAGLCLLLLIGGIAGTTVGLISAMKANRQLADAVVEVATQRDRARESEAKATTELSRSQLVTSFMRSMLRSVHPAVARDLDTTLLRQLLENAVKKLDGGEIVDEPAVEAEMRSTIAETYMGIGDNAAALRVIEPAIRLAHAAPLEQADQFRRTRIFYATTLVVWGRNAEAKAEFEQCMAIQESDALPEDETAGVLYSNFGGLQTTLGNTEEALKLHRRAWEIRRRTSGEKHGDVAASLGNIAGCLKDLRRYDESLAMMQEVLAVYRQAEPPRLLHITIVENNMADLLLLMDRPDEAEAIARDALDICARIYQPDQQQIGILTHTLGRALRAQARHDEARVHFAYAVKVLSAAFDHQHVFVAIARMDAGTELAQLGRFREAEQELLAAHEVLVEINDRPVDALQECTAAVVKLYEDWHQLEPDQDHLARASQWKVQLLGS